VELPDVVKEQHICQQASTDVRMLRIDSSVDIGQMANGFFERTVRLL